MVQNVRRLPISVNLRNGKLEEKGSSSAPEGEIPDLYSNDPQMFVYKNKLNLYFSMFPPPVATIQNLPETMHPVKRLQSIVTITTVDQGRRR